MSGRDAGERATPNHDSSQSFGIAAASENNKYSEIRWDRVLDVRLRAEIVFNQRESELSSCR